MEERSTRMEDLVDGGGDERARQSVEYAMENLQIHGNEGSNLGSTTALSDTDPNYSAERLPRPCDEVSNSARVQDPADASSSSWEDKIIDPSPDRAQPSRNAASSGSVANGGEPHEYRHFQYSGDSSREPSTAGVSQEEDWETVLDVLPIPPKTSSPTVRKDTFSNGKSAVKQRGRGSFTYGSSGLYSDNLDLSADDDGPGSSLIDQAIDGDTSHVLVIECSAKTTTKDVEELVEDFSKEGSCTVRWVDITRVLAVFSSPVLAREALVGINDGRFKVSMASEADMIPGSRSSVNDVAHPLPRPASSAQVAQRMIASALSRQGLSKQLLAKSQGSAQEIHKQERERKLRLQKRAQLRDEAWGSDED